MGNVGRQRGSEYSKGTFSGQKVRWKFFHAVVTWNCYNFTRTPGTHESRSVLAIGERGVAKKNRDDNALAYVANNV
ncbi:hypothetical protein RUND412_002954 [Rhizina undulata]